MSRTWFIADTHFHHRNILLYEPSRLEATVRRMIAADRLPATPEEIDSRLQEARRILSDPSSPQDLIEPYLSAHDSMMIDLWNARVASSDDVWHIGDFALASQPLLTSIVARLHGRIHLVRGNHDTRPDSFYLSSGFASSTRYPTLLKKRFLLSHEPLPEVPLPLFNIYGHIHSLGLAESRPNRRCASVECTSFAPIRIPEFDVYTPPPASNPPEESR